MANVGDILTNPESGYQRISCLNINVKYTGSWTYDAKNTYSLNISDYVEFYFYGTKIELCNTLHNSHSQNVIINIDGTEERFSQYQSSSTAQYYTLCYKKEGLEKKIHKVKIYSTETSAPRMSTIDIDEDGYMLYCDDNGKLYYDVTPIMTSNNTPSPYVVSASSEYTNKYKAFQAFDGVLYGDNTSFAPSTNNGWLCLDFGNKIKSNAFIIGTGSEGFFGKESYPKIIELSTSDSNIGFSQVESYTDITDWSLLENKKFVFNTQNSRFYKINVPLLVGNTPYLNIAELRYLLEVDTSFYLIQDNTNEKIYNYDEENNTLIEINDTSILKEDVLNNICIYDLNKIIPLLDTLSNDLTILCNNNKKIIAQGVKTTKELIIGKNSFSTKIARNIDSFQLDENATAKIIFSIDDGTTWKTYNSSTSAFEDLSISIPVDKDYSNFTDEEKTAWDEAKEVVYNQGIDSSILNTIDFNNLNAEKIRFGYILTATDAETMDRMTNLIWKFDSKGVMEVVDGDKVKQQLFYGGVKLISNIDADMLKVNITYEGIGGEPPH